MPRFKELSNFYPDYASFLNGPKAVETMKATDPSGKIVTDCLEDILGTADLNKKSKKLAKKLFKVLSEANEGYRSNKKHKKRKIDPISFTLNKEQADRFKGLKKTYKLMIKDKSNSLSDVNDDGAKQSGKSKRKKPEKGAEEDAVQTKKLKKDGATLSSSDDIAKLFNELPNSIQGIVSSNVDDLIVTIVDMVQQGEEIPEYLQKYAETQTYLDLNKAVLTPQQTLNLLNCFKNVEVLKMPYIDYTSNEHGGINSPLIQSIFERISTLENLRGLDMGLRYFPASPVDNFNDESLQLITSGGKLHSLNIANCRGITDKGLSHIAECEDLEYLNLSNCNLTDDSFSEIAKLQNLKVIDVSSNNNGITNEVVTYLEALPNIRFFVLSFPEKEGLLDKIKEFKNLSIASELKPYGCFLVLKSTVIHSGNFEEDAPSPSIT